METKKQDPRLGALWRFATAITVFNLFGHTLLGFEQAWAHPLLALLTAYSTEILLEWIEARSHRRPLRFLGRGFKGLVEFLLPAHISALAVAMLLYSNASLLPMVFATAAAIGSKYVFRVMVDGRPRHFFNPSNFGITATLLSFHWVGIAPPYMFTENLDRIGDWLLPAFLVCTGTFLNARFTKRIPLIAVWLGTFALQAVLRSAYFGTPTQAALMPMTGLAFLLFTFYMVSDPSTTPSSVRGQMLFGASVAATYGVLLVNHVVFTLFFSLSVVCTVRGILLAWEARTARAKQRQAVPLPVPAPVLQPQGGLEGGPVGAARSANR